LDERAYLAALNARNIRYAAPKQRTISNIHAFACMMAPSPNAAEMDQINDPAVIPDAKANPDPLPDAIDVPAMASVAGPGLKQARRAANRISGMLISMGIVLQPF
jgi:hypothetical protein